MSRYLSITTAIAAVFLGTTLAAPLTAQATMQDTIARMPAIVAAGQLVATTDSVARVSLLVPARATTLFDVGASATPVVSRTAFASEGGRNPAMMIVGGAAILVGGLIGGNGGSAIMIGGGVLGLAGLWNYLK